MAVWEAGVVAAVFWDAGGCCQPTVFEYPGNREKLDRKAQLEVGMVFVLQEAGEK